MTNPQRQTLQNLSRDLDLHLSEMPAAELGNLVHLLIGLSNYVAVWRDIAADNEAADAAAALDREEFLCQEQDRIAAGVS